MCEHTLIAQEWIVHRETVRGPESASISEQVARKDVITALTVPSLKISHGRTVAVLHNALRFSRHVAQDCTFYHEPMLIA